MHCALLIEKMIMDANSKPLRLVSVILDGRDHYLCEIH